MISNLVGADDQIMPSLIISHQIGLTRLTTCPRNNFYQNFCTELCSNPRASSCTIGGIVAIATTTTAVIVVVGNVLNALLSAQLTFCKPPLFCGTFHASKSEGRWFKSHFGLVANEKYIFYNGTRRSVHAASSEETISLPAPIQNGIMLPSFPTGCCCSGGESEHRIQYFLTIWTANMGLRDGQVFTTSDMSKT